MVKHQSVFWTCMVLTSNMNLQVLPLRVLVSRQVIADKMDYTGYLAGKTKSELDILDRLTGRFVVQASELTVERFLGGDKLPAEEWERRRSEIPGFLINFLDGMEDIYIIETFSSEARTWVMSDVDCVTKGFPLTSSWMLQANHWIHCEEFIEDGNLITAQKIFMMESSKLALDHWARANGLLDHSLVMEYRDSFSTDKKGNLVREFICNMPIPDIKITIVMTALRVVNSVRRSLRHCVLL